MIKKICSVLSMVVFLGLLVIAGFLFVPKMLGYDEYAVLSGSMEPGIPVGAIVYDKNFTGSGRHLSASGGNAGDAQDHFGG